MRIASRAAIVLVLLLCGREVRAQAQPRPSPMEGAGYPPPSLEPKPPSGIGAIVVGYAALGWAVMNLATLPVCTLDFYEQRDATTLCYGVSGGIAAVALSVAIPSIVIGHARRREYKAWRANLQTSALLSRIRFTTGRERLALVYGQRW